MKITKFSEIVAAKEGGKKSISIAQIKEVLRITNDETKGVLYAVIKGLSTLTLILMIGIISGCSTKALKNQLASCLTENVSLQKDIQTKNERLMRFNQLNKQGDLYPLNNLAPTKKKPVWHGDTDDGEVTGNESWQK